MTYVAQHEGLTACPACGGGRLICVVGPRLDVCLTCFKTWERLPAGEPFTTDGEQLPFDVPCDNCAFRGGSGERMDEERWRDLQLTLSHGGQFYCHKGVPFTVTEDGVTPVEGDRAFEFPKKTSAVDVAGKCHPYQGYDVDRMRLCRGYLNRFIGGLARAG